MPKRKFVMEIEIDDYEGAEWVVDLYESGESHGFEYIDTQTSDNLHQATDALSLKALQAVFPPPPEEEKNREGGDESLMKREFGFKFGDVVKLPVGKYSANPKNFVVNDYRAPKTGEFYVYKASEEGIDDNRMKVHRALSNHNPDWSVRPIVEQTKEDHVEVEKNLNFTISLKDEFGHVHKLGETIYLRAYPKPHGVLIDGQYRISALRPPGKGEIFYSSNNRAMMSADNFLESSRFILQPLDKDVINDGFGSWHKISDIVLIEGDPSGGQEEWRIVDFAPPLRGQYFKNDAGMSMRNDGFMREEDGPRFILEHV